MGGRRCQRARWRRRERCRGVGDCSAVCVSALRRWVGVLSRTVRERGAVEALNKHPPAGGAHHQR